MTNSPVKTIAVAIAAVLAGCSSLPEQIDTLEQARSQVRSLERDPLANEAAGSELDEARRMIQAADRSYENDEPIDVVEHEAYLARQHARIAEQRIAEARAREQIEQSETERTRVLLQARELEAERAQQLAEDRGARADAASARAATAEERAEQARESAELARQRAETSEQRAESLEQELSELKAEETERGLVLTLSDVLFDTDEADLKAGAGRTLDRLAQFMQSYPERRVLIEGHTDTRGSDQYNMDLSRRRADAVASALVERGVARDRVETAGLGEQYPIATNETTAGMQENRRVEIVLSDPQGQFPNGSRRAADAGAGTG